MTDTPTTVTGKGNAIKVHLDALALIELPEGVAR